MGLISRRGSVLLIVQISATYSAVIVGWRICYTCRRYVWTDHYLTITNSELQTKQLLLCIGKYLVHVLGPGT